MALADYVESSRVPQSWRETVWPSFEADVLQYLDHGCQRLQADPDRVDSWKERDYTWALCRHLERTNEERWDYLSPRYDGEVLSDKDFADGASPYRAPRIDLVVRWHHKEPEPAFGIEAKVLVTTKVGSYKPWDTVHDYVVDGMQRFVEGKYASGMPTGAMIGYVLSGTPAELVIRINEQIVSTPLACDLRLSARFNEPQHRQGYESMHPRKNQIGIKLLHTFLVFRVEHVDETIPRHRDHLDSALTGEGKGDGRE